MITLPAPRPVRITEAVALAALHATSFARPWGAQEFATFLGQPGMVGWIAGDPPTGFILLRAAADEAEILTLAVVPELRRRGIANNLLHVALAALSNTAVRRLFLEVDAGNVAAIALYEGNGFCRCGRRPGYYAARDGTTSDAIVMSKAFSGEVVSGSRRRRPPRF